MFAKVLQGTMTEVIGTENNYGFMDNSMNTRMRRAGTFQLNRRNRYIPGTPI